MDSPEMNKVKMREELKKKRISDLQFVIDTAARLNRLLTNEDFNLFIGKIKNKQRQYDNILHNPKQIGYVTRKATNLSGIISYVDFKYTAEDDNARLKDAQLRFDTFERVVTLISDFNDEAKRASQELSKLTENIQNKK